MAGDWPMSKPDKAANRSAIKAGSNAIFDHATPPKTDRSWWTAHAGPDSRADFIAAAKARAEHAFAAIGSFKAT